MKVARLIELLKTCDPDAEVVVFDREEQDTIPVTGMLYGGTDKRVELCSDDMQE